MGNTSSSANPRQQHHPSSSLSNNQNPDSPRRASSSRRSRSHTPASAAHRSHLSQSTTYSPNDGPAPPPRSPSLAPAPTPTQTDPPASDALTLPAAQQQDGAQTTQQQENTSTKKLPHRSLRTKKRSLELPDLALALTPAASAANGMTSTAATAGAVLPNAPAAAGAGVRRPQASSPIAIPNRVGAAPSSAASQAAAKQAALQERERERMRQIPTAAVELAPNAATATTAGAGRGRGVNAHIRGAPLQYNSTRSFAGATGRSGRPGATYTGSNGQERTMQSFALRAHPHGGFVPEDVHSSIPLALRKAELGDDAEAAEDDDEQGGVGAKEARAHAHELGLGLGLDESGEETERTLAQVCIVWRYGGRDVKLLRAGDNNWKGRTPMEYE